MDDGARREIAYDLGWDHAMYGLNLPEAILSDARDGYELGKSNFVGRTKSPDRFVRKWLQLRMNAYRRGRLVNDDVNPGFIAEIDTEQCPVTLLKLTHGALLESDWSVDRLNNNGAYARDNLAIISTKANTAKGSKSFEEVLALANSGETEQGLTQREWLRLACIMCGSSAVENPSRNILLPLATTIPNHCARPEWLQLQYCIVLAFETTASRRNKEHQKLRQVALNDKAHDLLENVFARMEVRRREVTYLYDAIVDKRIQEYLSSWFLGLDRVARAKLKVHMIAAVGGTPFTQEKLQGFSLATKGYA